MVSLLQRLYDPTEGGIYLDEKEDLRQVDAAWFRDQLGVVPQDPRLFSESIRENIAYGTHGLSQVRFTQHYGHWRLESIASCGETWGLISCVWNFSVRSA